MCPICLSVAGLVAAGAAWRHSPSHSGEGPEEEVNEQNPPSPLGEGRGEGDDRASRHLSA